MTENKDILDAIANVDRTGKDEWPRVASTYSEHEARACP